MMIFRAVIFGTALASLLPLRLAAHGDLHEQIKAVTEQIANDPKNSELYLKRGELHRAHQEWDEAQADYDHALALNPGLTIIDYTRGRMFLEADWPHSAKICLDRFLRKHTNHVEGFTTRARALVKLEKPVEAARDYTSAIRYAPAGRPELYIERAQALASAGEKHQRDALRGLDEGIEKLGPLVTLQLHAIDLELKAKKFDAALARLETISAQSPRKETWLARRGEILQLAGRKKEAQAAYEQALAALDSLPPARRNVPAMAELKRRIMAALEAVRPVSSPN